MLSIKSFIRGFLIFISLIGGYALLCLVGVAGMIVVGYFMSMFIGLSMDDSVVGIVGVVGGAICFTVYLLRQKSVRSGLVELWDQIRRNL